MRFASFHRGFLVNLDRVYNSPEFINSPRGFPSRERLNVHFTLTNPVERVCYLPSRRTNIVFNFAEALWYLSGDNSLAFIGYYGKRLARYTMDGETLTGTAYGPRIFSFGPDEINQWSRVIDLLAAEDPDSKRAVIQIFRAEEGLTRANIDVACTLALQFFVRNGRLYAASAMRANDAYRGIVSDVFSFTLIQELMAGQLGLDVGSYHHSAASLHTYDSDRERIQSVLDEFRSGDPAELPFQFPRMPAGDNWEHVKTVLEYERSLRLGQLRLGAEDVAGSGLPPYWQQVLLLLGLYRQVAVDKEPAEASLYTCLWPVYQYLFSNRWPGVTRALGAA